MEFGKNELISMLFYLGYLTITGEFFGKPELKIPNNVMKEIYSNYFLNILKQETNLTVEQNEYNEMLREIALEGSIGKIVELTEEYLNNLSNRDSIKFDEKYVKIIFYSIAMNLKIFRIKSEIEVNRKYIDLLITPRDTDKGYKSVLIEFKYLKKEEENKLKEKQLEAKEQLEQYTKLEEISNIPDLRKYTIVTVLDKMYVEEI